MNKEQFIKLANRKYATSGLPELDARDLPELARSTNQPRWLGEEYDERQAGSPQIKDFLLQKQARMTELQQDRTCVSCQGKFAPASDLELYLYCGLRFPPPQDYCPACLRKILALMDERESTEGFRCC